VDGAGKIPPASSVGNKVLSPWPRANPTDASGAFRSGPRAMEALCLYAEPSSRASNPPSLKGYELKPLITSLNLVATADIHFGYFSITPAAVRQIETLVKAPLLIRLPD